MRNTAADARSLSLLGGAWTYRVTGLRRCLSHSWWRVQDVLLSTIVYPLIVLDPSDGAASVATANMAGGLASLAQEKKTSMLWSVGAAYIVRRSYLVM